MKLGIKQTILTILNHKFLFACVVLFLFSAVLKVYLPTSILPEIFIVGLFSYSAIKPVNKGCDLFPKSVLPVWIFFFAYFIVASIVTHWGDDGSGFFNENYRLLTFLLITILLGNSKVDYLVLAKFCLWCCRFHIFFTIFELFYLTIVSFGDFYGVPLVGAAMPEMEQGVGYLKENDNLFSFGFRPFGLMLQPQKTGFVFVIGALIGILGFSKILNYLLKHHEEITMAFLIGVMLGSLRVPLFEISNAVSMNFSGLLPCIIVAVIAVTRNTTINSRNVQVAKKK